MSAALGPRLLVSVRNAEEAKVALEAGVDLIDLKEPQAGSLGPVSFETAADVVRLVAGRAPVSMALGEVLAATVAAVPEGVRWGKLGLAGCADEPQWRTAWRNAARRLSCAPVAVIYADFEACRAPRPELILAEAQAIGAEALLIDTAVKDGRGLLTWWTTEAVRRLADEARRLGIFSVAGGALTLETIPQVVDCGVDCIAVRGAACDGDRKGPISRTRIAAIRKRLG